MSNETHAAQSMPRSISEETSKLVERLINNRLRVVREVISDFYIPRTNYTHIFSSLSSIGRGCRGMYFTPDSELRNIVERVDELDSAWINAFTELVDINRLIMPLHKEGSDQEMLVELEQRKEEIITRVKQFVTTQIIPVLEDALEEIRRLDPKTHRVPLSHSITDMHQTRQNEVDQPVLEDQAT
jgi:hypothetical protein